MYDSTRTKGRIEKVSVGFHDGDFPNAVCVAVDDEGGYQSMIVMCSTEEERDECFRQLRQLFMVETNDELIGCECYALRYWPEHNEPIAGLEALNGARWTMLQFGRGLGHDIRGPVEQEKERLRTDITLAKRARKAAEDKMERVPQRMASWLKEELPKMMGSTDTEEQE